MATKRVIKSKKMTQKKVNQSGKFLLLSRIAIVAMVLQLITPAGFILPVAKADNPNASYTVVVDTVNGQAPSTCFVGNVTIAGHGTVTNGTGGGPSNYKIKIDWGDGVVDTNIPIVVPGGTASNAKTFNFTFTASHTALTVSTSTQVILYHGSTSGNDGSSGSVFICIAPPTNAAINISKTVVNDDLGTAVSSDFTLHVKSGVTDVSGSPFIGSNTGTGFILSPGAYSVTEDSISGYTMVSNTCGTGGNINLSAGDNITCNLTNDDNIFVNTAPTAANQTVSTNEDTPVVINMIATDPDLPAQTLTYSIVSGPTSGTLGTVSTNQVTYTPNTNSVAGDSFTFKANDGTADSNIATVTITVTGVNDNPVLDSIGDKTIDELTQLSFTATSTDVDLDTPIYSLGGVVPAGASINSSTGLFTWTPSESQGPGSYPVDIIVNDGNGGTDTETITITVNEVNVAPVATGASVSTHIDVPKLITMGGSDTDIPTQILTFIIENNPVSGTLGTISGAGVTYTPNAGFTGSDSFTFKINDGVAFSNIATINITVDNAAPILSPIGDQTVDELVPLSLTGGVDVVATDPDGDTLTYSITSGPVGSSINASTGDFSWTPSETDGPGVYPVTISVTDGNLSDSQTFNITVNEVNVAPVASNQSVNTNEDVALVITLQATDSDVPVQTLTYTIVAGPTNGTLNTITGNQVTYTPASDFSGSDSFTFKANDGSVDSNIATVDITVDPVNDPPTVVLIGSDPMNITAGSTFTDPGATGNDTEDGALTPVVTGSVDANTVGTYVLTYTVTDSGSLTASVTRTVVVNAAPVNNPPTVNLNGSGTINITEGDTFTDPGATGNDTEDGALTPVVTGSVDANTVGTYVLTYTVTDSGSLTAQVTRTVKVNARSNNGGGNGGGGGGGAVGLICSVDVNSVAVEMIGGQNSANVTLNFTYPSSIDTFAISNDPTFAGASFQTVVASMPWTLTGDSGLRTVYVRFHATGGCTADKAVSVGQVLGVQAPTPKVLGAETCSEYLTQYIKFGRSNNINEVKKLQTFLNEYMKENLTVDGVYNKATMEAVNRFQLANKNEVLKPWVAYGLKNENTSTGYVYKTTKRWINMIKCSSLNLPVPKLP